MLAMSILSFIVPKIPARHRRAKAKKSAHNRVVHKRQRNSGKLTSNPPGLKLVVILYTNRVTQPKQQRTFPPLSRYRCPVSSSPAFRKSFMARRTVGQVLAVQVIEISHGVLLPSLL